MKIGPAVLSLVEPQVLNTKIDLKYKRLKTVEKRGKRAGKYIKDSMEHL